MTPLHFAADRGHLSVVEILLRSDADINAVNKFSECIHTCNNTANGEIAIGHLYICIYSSN